MMFKKSLDIAEKYTCNSCQFCKVNYYGINYLSFPLKNICEITSVISVTP